MREWAEAGLSLAAGRTRQDLDADRMFRTSMERHIEVVGEAASQLSAPTRELYCDLPWREIRATRNVLAHGYQSVDRDVLWGVITEHLPPLLARVEEILAEGE